MEGQDIDPARTRRDARLLWAAQYVSATGDSLFMPAIGWLAGGITGEGLPVGFAVFVATLPHLLFGPLAGSFADRFDRRGLMIVSDLGRALLLVGFPLLAVLWGGPTFGAIVVLAFLLAALSAPFMAARDAFLPELVGVDELPRWNAWIATSSHIALVQGLALGGLVLLLMEKAGLGANETDRILWLLGFDGLTFVVSAVLLVMIVGPARRRIRVKAPLLKDVVEGLRYAKRDPEVGGLLVLTALNNFAIMGPAIVGAILLVQKSFGLGMMELTWFEGSMAVGMLFGALYLARFGKRHNMAKVLFLGLVIDGLTYIPFLWIPSYEASIPLIAAHGFFIPFIVVARTSLVQMHVPDEKRGKVFALVNLTVMGMTSLSALVCGFLGDAYGARVLFLLAGVFGALTGIIGWFVIGSRLASIQERQVIGKRHD